MYGVSQEFLKAIQSNTRTYYWTGRITTKFGIEYQFTNEDIVKGSGYITHQCSGSTEIEIGSVYSGELGITLLSTIDRYSLEDGIIELFFHLEIGSGIYETIPMGIYEISEANRSLKCLEIKAYDYMLRFEKSFLNKVTSGTAYDFLVVASSECQVELAQTKEEFEKMSNGLFVLGVYPENDVETWRDLIYYIGQVLGCFATINREGKLEFRKYTQKSIIDISSYQRFTSSFSDFVTRYTAISSTNIKTQESEYYALEVDDALTMNLGVNPLLQFGLSETRKTLLNNILDNISAIKYIPFDSTFIGNPALDLGDVLTFSGGHADKEQLTTITSISYQVNGKQSLKCVGKNPRLAQAKSKSDKNIIGLLNQIEAGKIAVHSYVNASPFSVSSTETEIISIEFASNDDTDAQFNASIILTIEAAHVEKIAQASRMITQTNEDSVNSATTQEETFTIKWLEIGNAVIQVRYILNDYTVTTFYPTATFCSGKHTLNLYYPLSELIANTYNTFKVLINCTGGAATIDRGQTLATVSGQGLAANKVWDGNLEFSDDLEVIVAGNSLHAVYFNEQVKVAFEPSKPEGLALDYPVLSFGGISLKTFREDLHVITEGEET